MGKLVFEEETYAIRGALFEVYKTLGNGFLEAVYQECLMKEFIRGKIEFESQPTIRLYYKHELLEQLYKPDFICYGKIIVELKAVSELLKEHRAQLYNYLKATGFRLGLLANFGHHPNIEIERVVL